MSVQLSCPGCGAAIEFKTGSGLVAVCPYCRSVVARGDRKVEDLGKVAALVETDSPLAVGLRGHFQGKPFEITGRAQLGHSAGGVWDEWYAAFPHNQWGWLAEAQGRFYLTFPETTPAGTVPPYERLQLGEPLRGIHAGALRVAEKGHAEMRSAEGEIPYRLTPGDVYTYADLSGPGAAFGTLDYSDAQPHLYYGREVTLDELGIATAYKLQDESIRDPRHAPPPSAKARQIDGKHLNCPQCGGALELRAPDKTERVACPSCGALLDCTQGVLRFLEALKPGEVPPVLPLGAKGTLREGPMMVIGMVQRSVTFEGIDYFWEEYLLYEPRLGFRWLVKSDDHWSYVMPIAPGNVSGGGAKRWCLGNTFKLFQKADATVRYVIGEFYWKVSVGETVETADYICPPQMLSREVTAGETVGESKLEQAIARALPTAGDGEINWSLGTYLTVAEVEKAFGVQGLERPSGIAPNQPYPYKGIYWTWALLSLAAFALGVLFMAFSPNRQVMAHSYPLRMPEGPDKTQVIFTEPMELRARHNVQVTADAAVSNSWLGVEGDFVNEDTGLVQAFYLPIEYYYGVEDGESWSEGGQRNSTLLSALPAGKYVLRLEIAGEAHKPLPPVVTIRVEQGVKRWLHLILTLLLLAVVPGIMMLYHLHFEYRRWQDSDYSPFRSDD